MAILQHLTALGATFLQFLVARVTTIQQHLSALVVTCHQLFIALMTAVLQRLSAMKTLIVQRLTQLMTLILQGLSALREPFATMVFVQVLQGLMQIFNKVAVNRGLHPFVLLFYRQVFATLSIAPLAYYKEWNNLPPITWPIIGYLSLCGIFGVAGNQCLYTLGLMYTTPTIASAIAIMLPGVTFVMSVIFRQEKFEYTTRSGVAKIVGTVVVIAGGTITTLYKGPQINIRSGIIWPYFVKSLTDPDKQSWEGTILVIGSCISQAAWIIILRKMGTTTFNQPFTTTAVTGFFGVFISGIIAVSVERHADDWSLSSPIRYLSLLRWIPAVYGGLIGSSLASFFTTQCIIARGTLYVSSFTPLMHIFVAIGQWLLQNHLIFFGNFLASLLIILGFSLVQWGLWREERQRILAEQPLQQMEEVQAPAELV